MVRQWREAFLVLAKQQRIPRLDRVTIAVTPHLGNRRGLQDVAGCHPAAKAAIDGLVDAGVLSGDGPDVVTQLCFAAPVIGQGDALELRIEEIA